MAKPSDLGQNFVDRVRNSENTVWVGEAPIMDANQLAAITNNGLNTNQSNPLLSSLIADAPPTSKDNNIEENKIGTRDGFHISVEDDGDKNVSETTFRLENLTDKVMPTLGGAIGATVAPYQEEWMVGVDAEIHVNGRFIVVKAAEGEDLGAAGYKSSQTISTDLHIYSQDVEQPLKATSSALFGMITSESTMPAFDIEKSANNLDLSGMLNSDKAPLSFIPEVSGFSPSSPQEAPHTPTSSSEPTTGSTEPATPKVTAAAPQEQSETFSMLDGNVSFSGEYRVGVELNVDIQHRITVSAADYDQVKEALHNQNIYSASVAGEITVYNPGGGS